MTIRIPPKADIETRNAFLDIEERLRKLETQPAEKISEVAETPAVEVDPDINVEGDLTVANDVRIEGSIDAPHLFEGLIKVVPTAIGSAAQRTINMGASLAIAPGGLSADSVRCRELFAIRPSCYVYRLAAQTISNNTVTDILWTHEHYDNAGMHDTSANTDRITITESGLYLIGGHVHWDTNSTGSRTMFITLNDDSPSGDPNRLLSQQKNSPDDSFGRMSGCTIYPLSTGDILRLSVVQVSGGDLDTRAWLSPRDIGFWATKVSD